MRFIDILNKDREQIGLDTVVYTNKTIDEVVYVDSDGTKFTLKDIFETNSLISSSDMDLELGWELVSANGSADNSIFSFTATAQYGRLRQGFTYDTGVDYYWNVKFKADSNQLTFNDGVSTFVSHSGSGDFEQSSGIKSAVGFYVAFNDNKSSAWTEVQVDWVYAIDLRIFTSTPSQAKLDEWFEIYRARRRITKETYTLREFIALSIIENGFLDDAEDSWIFGANVTEHEVIDGRLLTTLKHAGSTGGNWVYQNVFTADMEDDDLYIYVDYEIQYLADGGSLDFQVYQNFYVLLPLLNVSQGDKSFHSGISKMYGSVSLGTNITFGLANNSENLGYLDNVILINQKNFDEFMTKENMDFIVTVYKKVKYQLEDSDKTYAVSGKSKNSIAYTNKTIDEVVYEDKTLRDIFEHGNEVSNPFFYDSDDDGQADNITGYRALSFEKIGDKQRIYSDGTFDSFGLYASPMAAVSIITNHTYYFSLGIEQNIALFNGVQLRNANSSYKQFSVAEEADVYSFLDTCLIANHNLTPYMQGKATALTTNDYVDFSNLFIIDTALFSIVPSQEQMDAWRNMYLARKNLEKIELSYSDIFERAKEIPPLTLPYTNIQSSGTYYGTAAWDWNLDHSKDNHNIFYYGRVRNTLNLPMGFFAVLSPTLGNFLFGTKLEGYFNINVLDYESFNFYLSGLSYTPNHETILDEWWVIDKTLLFDENITDSKMIEMYEKFKIIQNIIIVPEVFLITEPVGFGSRYKMKELNGRIYGHELDFENIGFKVNFGINYNAYEGFNLLQNHLKDNEGIIEYDWGKGSRYADVRLLRAPKTEKDTLSLLRSKYDFKMLNPFYEIISFTSNQSIKNTHEQDITPVIELVTSSDSPSIEFENDDTSVVDIEIAFDFTGLSKPVTVIIDSENNTIKFADGTNAYDYVDKTKNTFVSLAYDIPYIIYWNNITSFKLEYKQWVVD